MSKTTEKTPQNKAEVFVSYSHQDEKWKDMLEPYLKTLQHGAGISYWDDRQISTGDDWYPNIQEKMKKAKVAICLISVNYLASDFIQKEEIPFLIKKRKKEGLLLIPILIRDCPWKVVRWLKNIQMIPSDGKSLVENFKGKENIVLNEVVYLIDDHLKQKTKGSQKKAKKPVSQWKPLAKKNIDIDRLPVTGAELFGRDKELKALDKLWDSDSTNVVSFIAWGGVGKSTLINKWLQYMGEDNYRGAKKVFGWSFYSQGTNDKVTSADRFIRDALEWFGDKNPDEGSAWDKGKRLGKLIGAEKNLLVLDGMEPLQSGLDIEKGKIKDPALEMLLKQLAKKNEGLCIITTREEVPDMKKFGDAYQEIELEQISKEAGRALLRVQGVRGSDNELESAVENFDNHALAINLLGSYLHDIPEHHISEANKIEDIDVEDERSRHPRRVIKAWEERLGEGPELNILRIMGLFDRPADEGAVEALRKKPSIKYLTDHIGRKDIFSKALRKLRSLNLIAKESEHDPGTLDAHPIIRQHFAEQDEQNFSETWIEANNRLYQYYKSVPKEFPETLEEMQPLFFAVTHGCAAGKYQEVLIDIYWKRINRKNEFYLHHKLGAKGIDLSLISKFFEKKWNKPVSSLEKIYQIFVLGEAGFRLRRLGYINEAIQSTKISLDSNVSLEEWEGASQNAQNLSEFNLVTGNLYQSIQYAYKGVEFADQSEATHKKVYSRTDLAWISFQLGQIDKAEQLFMEAERMFKEWKPSLELLCN